MASDEDKILLTTAWLFMEHGQQSKAKALCYALNEEYPEDGAIAAFLAQLLLDDAQNPAEALAILRKAVFPAELRRAEALLEARALTTLGRKDEAAKRWQRYLDSRKGPNRKWVVDK